MSTNNMAASWRQANDVIAPGCYGPYSLTWVTGLGFKVRLSVRIYFKLRYSLYRLKF